LCLDESTGVTWSPEYYGAPRGGSSTNSTRVALLAVVLLSALAIGGCHGMDNAKRRELYSRSDETFRSALLWKPAVDEGSGAVFDLAPLLLQESETPDLDRAPAVLATESTVEIGGGPCRQLTYSWRYPSFVQGVRMTLGADGFPAIFEVLHDSSGARVVFVASSLEEAASAEFGDPLPGRSFAIERSTAETPGIVVAGTLEPGPAPLGPFVYLSAGEHDVIALICRCTPSRVETVLDSSEYPLATAGDGPPAEGGGPEELLRLPSAFGCS
jgi:hypothetical protein